MSADVLAKVTEEEVQRFQEEGAVRLRDVFDPYWVDRVAAGVERNLAEPGPYAKLYTPKGNPGFFFGDYCNWSRFPELREPRTSHPSGHHHCGRRRHADRPKYGSWRCTAR